MATNSKNLGHRTVFPPGLINFFKRRCKELLGLIFLGLSGAMFLALISFNPIDPSINTANPFEPKNSLGNFGATFADLSLQTIGLAIFIFAFTIAVFGWKLLRHIGLGRIWLRITCLIIGLITLSMGVASIPKFESWPLVSGYGGAVGDFLLLRTNEFLLKYFEVNSGLVGATASLIGIACFLEPAVPR